MVETLLFSGELYLVTARVLVGLPGDVSPAVFLLEDILVWPPAAHSPSTLRHVKKIFLGGFARAALIARNPLPLFCK